MDGKEDDGMSSMEDTVQGGSPRLRNPNKICRGINSYPQLLER